jgi:hypothetical protein
MMRWGCVYVKGMQLEQILCEGDGALLQIIHMIYLEDCLFLGTVVILFEAQGILYIIEEWCLLGCYAVWLL